MHMKDGTRVCTTNDRQYWQRARPAYGPEPHPACVYEADRRRYLQLAHSLKKKQMPATKKQPEESEEAAAAVK